MHISLDVYVTWQKSAHSPQNQSRLWILESSGFGHLLPVLTDPKISIQDESMTLSELHDLQSTSLHLQCTPHPSQKVNL